MIEGVRNYPLFFLQIKMERIITIILAIIIGSSTLSGQSAQGDFEKQLPDSVKYYLPEFMEGRIIYKDGGFSTAKFNISTIDQTIRFIDADGKVMGIKDNASVDRASIGGSLFIRYRTYYLAFALDIDGIYLCATRKLLFGDEKKGAFGSESSTSNIKEIKRIEGQGGLIFDLNGNPSYEVRTIPFIYRNKVAYAPTKKLLLRFFKDQSDIINAYLDTNKVNFNDFNQVYQLMSAIKQSKIK